MPVNMHLALETVEAEPRAVEKHSAEWPSAHGMYLGRVLRREPGKYRHETMLWLEDGTGYSVGAPNVRNVAPQGNLL